jgi:serine/threonine-protein phosphatase 2B catalytic subunit
MAEPLCDPCQDRVIKSVEPPPHSFLTSAQLFPRGPGAAPDLLLLKNHLKREGRVMKADALQLMRAASEQFRKEKTLLELKYPVIVVGDIHGQFYDLLKLLDMAGDVASNRYLFLGDYVDRGSFSVEVLLVLYALKLNYPQNIFMIRGNHECRQMTTFFNFRSECLFKYDLEFYEVACESFDMMPLACVINKKFIALHGGISPELVTVEDLTRVNRYTEPPRQGLFCDVLWSDPVANDSGASPEKYKVNEVRGCSYFFNASAVNTFLKRNKLLTVIRAHEAQLEGYKMHTWNGPGEFPVVITIFSAPNYCDVYNNKGAIIKFDDNNLNIQQFNYSGHPYILPNFMDLFSWSIPFVIEKVLEIMCQVVNPSNSGRTEPVSGEKVEELKETIKESKTEIFRNKVKAMSKMMKMFKTLREDKEIIMQLKGLCPDNKIPKGLIQQGRRALEGALDSFTKAKEWDIVNEKRPEV